MYRVFREVSGRGWVVVCEMSSIPTALYASAALFTGEDLAQRDRLVLEQRSAITDERGKESDVPSDPTALDARGAQLALAHVSRKIDCGRRFSQI